MTPVLEAPRGEQFRDSNLIAASFGMSGNVYRTLTSDPLGSFAVATAARVQHEVSKPNSQKDLFSIGRNLVDYYSSEAGKDVVDRTFVSAFAIANGSTHPTPAQILTLQETDRFATMLIRHAMASEDGSPRTQAEFEATNKLWDIKQTISRTFQRMHATMEAQNRVDFGNHSSSVTGVESQYPRDMARSHGDRFVVNPSDHSKHNVGTEGYYPGARRKRFGFF